MVSLDGQLIGVVTGGASGIGEACVRRLAELGHSIVIADYTLEHAQQLADELGDCVLAVQADVTSEQDCLRMVQRTVEHFGRLDFAVNNAGTGNRDSSLIGDIGLEEWRRIMAVNLDGVFLSVSAEAKQMKKSGGGSIVNISSVMGVVATRGAGAYVASKHGVVGLTKAAALDYAPAKIRVNAIGPGYVETPMLVGRLADQPAEVRHEVEGRHPIGRIAKSDEIADAVAYMVSPAASFITGAYLPVDGGYTAK
ncbi:SDR family NAD(P)-dependent oxidoreductase [Pseudarthrobacter sp. IC2-21]|uniref:SDR family NAD(P)-dependent oxidoreductase n=1 Tax=Pseudarthrobacter sp. IC2-21 TaxID=3092262 RepID=UPI002A6AC0B5|nr:SDR family NAD(P)-dependent oxidoreductase [Pseudarthrobacter sp. IC2-21]